MNIVGKIGLFYYVYDEKTYRCFFIPEEIYKILEEYVDFSSGKIDDQGLKSSLDLYDENSREYILSFLKEIKENYVETSHRILSDQIEMVDLMITNRCNLNCRHCSSRCSSNNKQFMCKNDILGIISIIKDWGIKQLIITGGEPLVVEWIDEIMHEARMSLKEAHIVLATNGMLIDKHIGAISKYIDSVNISMDGYDEESVCKIRGKGVFSKVISNIELLKQYTNVKVNLSMVVLDSERENMDKFVALSDMLGTTHSFRALCNLGRANGGEYIEKVGFEGYPNVNFLTTSGIKSKAELNILACNAYRNKIYINHDGKLYPCPSLRNESFEIANILDYGGKPCEISRLMYGARKKIVYDKEFFKGSECGSCDNKYFCWICPADFVIARENYDVKRLCSIMKPRIEKMFY